MHVLYIMSNDHCYLFFCPLLIFQASSKRQVSSVLNQHCFSEAHTKVNILERNKQIITLALVFTFYVNLCLQVLDVFWNHHFWNILDDEVPPTRPKECFHCIKFLVKVECFKYVINNDLCYYSVRFMFVFCLHYWWVFFY